MRLTISTQPISISRSPRSASSPVVSVSRTISRSIAFPSPTRAHQSQHVASSRPIPRVGLAATTLQRFDDLIDLGSALGDRSPGIHDEICARPLVAVVQLARQDLLELFQ